MTRGTNEKRVSQSTRPSARADSQNERHNPTEADRGPAPPATRPSSTISLMMASSNAGDASYTVLSGPATRIWRDRVPQLEPRRRVIIFRRVEEERSHVPA